MNKNKDFESQKKYLINATKKYENEYSNIIDSSTKYEDKFINVINECIKGIKNISCDLNDKIKEITLTFFTSIRESFKIPLDLIDINIPQLKEIDQKDLLNKAIIKCFNNESKLVNIIPERYNLKSLEINKSVKERKDSVNNKSRKNSMNNNDNSYFSNKKSGFIKFEDGFEEMSYFEDDVILYTVREMFNNFDLINHNGVDIDIEEEKNATKTFVSKIIKNMLEKLNKKLLKLLDKHDNRVIFLHKLNDYRANNKFELTEKEYNILGELFSHTLNVSKTQNDYHCIELVIVLSKTYYIMKDKDNKIYLLNSIVDQKFFKTKDFWHQ